MTGVISESQTEDSFHDQYGKIGILVILLADLVGLICDCIDSGRMQCARTGDWNVIPSIDFP
jgi:hypothetical protein